MTALVGNASSREKMESWPAGRPVDSRPGSSTSVAKPTVSVVIPALNESKNLDWVAANMPSGVHEIILVDGHSTDGTPDVARSLWPDVRVMSQTRRGKGNALACGFFAATSDIIVMLDADGSMDPGEIPNFIAALCEGAEYAKGSRFTDGGGSSDITTVRTFGNRVFNTLTNVLHGSTFSDLCYGYNAFWRNILPALRLDPGTQDESDQYSWGDGFEIETLMNIRAHRAGLRIREVPSYEWARRHGRSNLNARTDGLRVLRTIALEWARAPKSVVLDYSAEGPLRDTSDGAAVQVLPTAARRQRHVAVSALRYETRA